uniref:Mitochondrial carrier protein n=1 Tax=Haptolina ericina TaxID=156174 RepID=A0A7S3AQW8_9EUKA
MVECASKGAILLYSKEAIAEGCAAVGIGSTSAGFIAGAGGGVCQTIVMGPSTFLVTAVVTGNGSMTVAGAMATTWRDKGLPGFYPGGIAIALRQATNWASRQGFTDLTRRQMGRILHADPKAKLSLKEEAVAGMVGGMLSCWNHPFEVARIEIQARAMAGEGYLNMAAVFRMVYAEYGIGGLFKGLVPRMMLNIWQTLFMVSGAKLIKEQLTL